MPKIGIVLTLYSFMMSRVKALRRVMFCFTTSNLRAIANQSADYTSVALE